MASAVVAGKCGISALRSNAPAASHDSGETLSTRHVHPRKRRSSSPLVAVVTTETVVTTSPYPEVCSARLHSSSRVLQWTQAVNYRVSMYGLSRSGVHNVRAEKVFDTGGYRGALMQQTLSPVPVY